MLFQTYQCYLYAMLGPAVHMYGVLGPGFLVHFSKATTLMCMLYMPSY